MPAWLPYLSLPLDSLEFSDLTHTRPGATDLAVLARGELPTARHSPSSTPVNTTSIGSLCVEERRSPPVQARTRTNLGVLMLESQEARLYPLSEPSESESTRKGQGMPCRQGAWGGHGHAWSAMSKDEPWRALTRPDQGGITAVGGHIRDGFDSEVAPHMLPTEHN